MNCGPKPPQDRSAPIEPLDLAKAVARAAWDGKAQDLVVIDITGRSSYADFIVVCSGSHARHSSAIAQNIVSAVKQDLDRRPRGVEGQDSGRWVLIDYGDIVVHVFERSQRNHYDLDGLWADAKRVPLAELGITDAPTLGAVLPQPFTSAPG